MIDQGSRYAKIETATLTAADGREISYLKRRFLPDGAAQPLLAEVTIVGGDRLDLIAARVIGEPTHWWRIADANNAIDPLDLVDQPGSKIRIAVPQP
jgi:hypothetical protein